jgi:hypothetical protein
MYNIIAHLIAFFLLTSPAFARGVLRDSCDFTCASDTTLVTASTVICQTPSGSSAWTEDQDTCTSTHTCISASGRGRSSAALANCILMTRPPTSPGIATYDVRTTLIESGTTAAADCQGIYARYTATTSYYSFMVCDDVTSAGFARLYLQNGALYAGTTSLGTAAGFGNSYSNVVVLKIRNDKKQVLKDGVQIISSTNNALTSAGTAGVVCGQAQVSGDDCNTTLLFDNFIIIDQPRRIMNASLITEARAEEVRDGRWYISPLVHERGVWQPKIETMKAGCSTSNVIDPAKPSVLSYVKCDDYSKLDNDKEVKFIYDEAKKPLDKKAIEMLEGIGKPIDQNFNPLGTYVR